jgi:hypothetical protein
MSGVHYITIQHEKFGQVHKQEFFDSTQFCLFLKMVQGCIELKNDLTFFDGGINFLHIPSKTLCECLITTKTEEWTLMDHMKSKTQKQNTK